MLLGNIFVTLIPMSISNWFIDIFYKYVGVFFWEFVELCYKIVYGNGKMKASQLH